MLNENAKLWIKALRSGKYNQTKGALRRPDGSNDKGVSFCCLGVACDLYIKRVPKKNRDKMWKADLTDDNVTGGCFRFKKSWSSLPDQVIKWLGLNYASGSYGITGTNSLVSDNDDNNKSFSEIADIIESQPERLFVKQEKQNEPIKG